MTTELRNRMIADMRSAGLAASTQEVYIHGVRGLAAYYRRSPDLLSEAEVRSYLLYLRDERGVARGTFAPCHGRHPLFLCPHAGPRLAAVFKKRVRPPKRQRLPEVLSDAEARSIVGRIRKPSVRAAMLLMYACGLRIGEAAAAEVTHIDGVQGSVRVIGKGNKERLVPLPEPVLIELRRLWTAHRNPALALPQPERHQAHLAPVPIPGLPGGGPGSRHRAARQPAFAAAQLRHAGFWKAAWIPGSCRFCSGTPTSRRRLGTRT